MAIAAVSKLESGASPQARPWFLFGAILSIGLVISLLGYAATKRIVERSTWQTFHRESVERSESIETAIRSQIAALTAVRGLIAASLTIDRAGFRIFAETVDLGAGVYALEWIPRVSHRERATFEAAGRADGLRDFRIQEFDENGQLIAARQRAEYFPIFFAEPLSFNRPVLGFDLASHTKRRQAMEQARDQGTAVATELIDLIQMEGDHGGFLVLLPVYSGMAVPETVAERRANLIGFAISVYHAQSLFDSILASHGVDRGTVRVDVYEAAEAEQERLIYSNYPRGPLAEEIEHPGRNAISNSFDVAGRRWRFDMSPPPDWQDPFDWQPWLVLGVGLGLTVVALLFVRLIVDRGRFADELARQRTVELSEVAVRLRAEIEERNAIETALRASDKHLRDSIDSLADGFALYDANDRLVMWNDRYEEFDYRIRKRLKPGVTYQELSLAGAKAGQWRDSIYSLLQERVDPRSQPERERQLADGRWLLIKSHATSDGGLVDIRSDITDLKVQNEELRYHRDELEKLVAERTRALEEQAMQLGEALDKEKEYNILQQQFISMVSHEFRTPLAIIDSTAQRMLRRRQSMTPDEVEQRAGKVRTAVKRLVLLIEDTLAMSRMQAGRIELRREEEDLKALISETCEQQRQLATSHPVLVDTEKLPAQVSFDPGLMRQVLTNLLSNAVKYSPDGGGVKVVGGVDGDFVFVAVGDQGIGVPAADLPNLGSRFFRATNVSGIAGTGIGLNLCRHIVELHGGALVIDSTEGKGSTFTVRIPLEGPEEASAPDEGAGEAVLLSAG